MDQSQDITLKRAVEIGQQFELSQAQVKFMRGEEVLKSHKKHPTKSTVSHAKSAGTGKPKISKHNDISSCSSCGLEHGKCPAIGSTCSYCKQRNHWKKVCRRRLKHVKVSRVQTDTDSGDSEGEEPLTISMCTSVNSIQHDGWDVHLGIKDQQVRCRIDTGAQTSILTSAQIKNLRGCKIENSKKTLKSFSNHKIKPIGSISVVYRDRKINVHFEVVDLDQENIISGDTAVALRLIHKVNPGSQIHVSVVTENETTESAQSELSRDFPELVKTTGTLLREYQLSTDESVPTVIHPVRKLTAAIKPKAVEKLREMESNGYITKVDRPTEWVSSMVVSVKGKKIRICIYPRDLNRAIKREHHPMKTIEDVISDISKAKIFSVLDAKSEFLQVQLDEKSSYLTTFHTPIGKYRWLRLPFGIKSAPEIYQKIMDNMIKGASAIIDDILIAGERLEEHDAILRKVVERATS